MLSAGGVIFAITCVFVVVSRNIELKIMSKRGVSSWHLYAAYLQVGDVWLFAVAVRANSFLSLSWQNMEENSDRAAEKRRLNVDELKIAVLSAKSKSMKVKRHHTSENLLSGEIPV